MVEAPGFVPRLRTYSISGGKDRIVLRRLELGLPTSAAGHAETTHTVGKVMNLDNLIFALGKAKIEPASFEELDQVVKMLPNLSENGDTARRSYRYQRRSKSKT